MTLTSIRSIGGRSGLIALCFLLAAPGGARSIAADARTCGDEYKDCPVSPADARALQDDVDNYHDRYIGGWQRQFDRSTGELQKRRARAEAIKIQNNETENAIRQLDQDFRSAKARLDATPLDTAGHPIAASEKRAQAESLQDQASLAFQQAFESYLAANPGRAGRATEAGNTAARPIRKQARRFIDDAADLEANVERWRITVETASDRITAKRDAIDQRTAMIADLLDVQELGDLQAQADEARDQISDALPALRAKQALLGQVKQTLSYCISYAGLQARNQEMRTAVVALAARDESLFMQCSSRDARGSRGSSGTDCRAAWSARCDRALPPIIAPAAWSFDDPGLYIANCRAVGQFDALAAFGCR